MNANAKWSIRLAFLLFCLGILFMVSADAVADGCDIRLGDSRSDFGRIMRPDSNVTSGIEGMHAIGQRSVSFTGSCDRSGEMALVIRGERLADAFKFSRRGKVSVIARNALLDGRSVQLMIVRANGAGAGSYSAFADVGPDDTLIPVLNGLPAVGRLWTMTLEVHPKIPMSDLRTADAKTPEANITFELRQR